MLTLVVVFLTSFGIITLRSVAPFIFPAYYVYFVIAFLAFIFFAKLDFNVLSAFSNYFYVGSIIFLLLPLIVGQVTRGAVRWIPIGAATIQPAEIVRPFLFIFFANYLTIQKITRDRFFKTLGLLALPVFLILVQPSLGVAVLTVIGFAGILIASGLSKKTMFAAVLVGALSLPVSWFLLAPYQKDRVLTFLSPYQDPFGAGYNSIQSMISVGSGGLWGRGLGEGVQTQLAFLPERHTDFIFASVAEEFGFAGACLLLFGSFFLLYRIIKIMDFAGGGVARAFLSGVFLTLLVQTVVHIGMNMGLFPITGVPLPLVSAGGSSLLATSITLGMAISTKK